jgi:hypothetical protein
MTILRTDRAGATPPVCPVAPGVVRFGGLVMTTDHARRLALQLLAACGTADDTPAAPSVAGARPDAITVTLYDTPAVLTLDEAMLLLGELRSALVAATAAEH